MRDDEPSADRYASPTAGDVVGSFRIERLVSSSGDLQVSRARDQHVDRAVLLRVAHGETATCLLDDARQIATMSHPSLVVVLGAGTSDGHSFAAVAEPDGVPLAQVGELSSDDGARLASEIAGAIAALSDAGLRSPVNGETVLVSRMTGGVHGLLDPLRGIAPGTHCLAAADPIASTRELVGLLERAVPAPSHGLRDAIAGIRANPASGPAELAAALAALIPAQRAASRRWQLPVGVLAVLAIAAIVAAAIVHETSGGSSRATATEPTPAARVSARIPLGLPAAELAGRLVLVGKTAWISTSVGRLLRVDTTTNQLVGSPISLGGQHPRALLIGSAGQLFTVDVAGWLLRIDPRTGHVTKRRHLGSHLTAVAGHDGVLWITADDGTKGSLLRVSESTFQSIGKPIAALPAPRQIAISGSRAFVLGGTESADVLRIDVATGRRTLTRVGSQVFRLALDHGTLWVPEYFDGTVSPLDTGSMAFTRSPLHVVRSAFQGLPLGADVWVAATSAIDGGKLSVARFDAASGRRVGTDVPLGMGGTVYGMTSGLGSLWLLTTTTLVRLAPTTPRPPLAPAVHPGPAPHALVAGPLQAGTWRTTTFAVPTVVSTPGFAWIATHPEPDALGFASIAGGKRSAELDISAPRQMFDADGSVRAIPGPAGLVGVLRRNPHVQVGTVRHLTVGGRPALQFRLDARKPPMHPEVCGPIPCVLMFPVQEGTNKLEAGDPVRITLVRASGHTLVIAEDSQNYDRTALAATAALLRTVRFPG